MFLKALLAFIPIGLIVDWRGVSPTRVFLTSALAIVPLTALIGEATENLSARLGQALGDLLNATMGNVPEIVIGIFALRKGLTEVVKALITGSILGNVLLILGLSLIAGGSRHKIQKFDTAAVGISSKLLILASIGLLVPALFRFTSNAEGTISLEIAGILFLVYVGSLVFTLVTNKQVLNGKQADGPEETGRAAWSLGRSSATLAASALALAVMSEALTGSIGPTADSLGLTPVFAGIFLQATVGNISSLINAVQFARRDKMDLTLSVTLGAGVQVALLVAPALVVVGHLSGHPMDLLFSRLEVISIIIATVVGRTITADGESNWLEGLVLVAV